MLPHGKLAKAVFRPVYPVTEQRPFVVLLFIGKNCETFEQLHTREEAVVLADQWRAELLAGGYGLEGAVLDYDLSKDRQTVQ